MPIAITEVQRDLRESVRSWAAGSGTAEIREREEPGGSGRPGRAWKGLAELGVFGIALPEEVGGAGAGIAELAAALEPYGVAPDRIPTAFNCFMNVPIDGETGKLRVLPPISKAGDHIAFVAKMDLVIGLTACSAPDSNGGTFKPIHYRVEPSPRT